MELWRDEGGGSAWAHMGLADTGGHASLNDYSISYTLGPAELRVTLQNSADLNVFDLISDIGITGEVPATRYMNGLNGSPEFYMWGKAETWYQNMTLTVFTAPVPEPTTWAMLGVGLLMIGAASRRKRT